MVSNRQPADRLGSRDRDCVQNSGNFAVKQYEIQRNQGNLKTFRHNNTQSENQVCSNVLLNREGSMPGKCMKRL
ncbi:hypothetical protein TNCT_713821 [Trichonephila clavata]|uniref:Uncharacterized protein n=1 Tax=Trichonephila clavata TaxID=2740835 RepID=A0A8X6I3H5_TRICU|nr:hypothetical protein TNCT_713821 [Trichonephila clavata]